VDVPLGCTASEFFNLLAPQDDSAGNPLLHRGLVNINTAPAGVLKCLPGLAALDPPGPRPNATAVADEIIAYRDKGSVPGRDYGTTGRDVVTGITNLRFQAGFACASEVAIPLRMAMGVTINNNYFPTPGDNYALNSAPVNDDGIPINLATNRAVENDPIKQHVLYAWLSDQVTVRSNTFIVYIRVQRGNLATFPNPRRYVAVIDRGNCRAANARPKVLMFAELR
jgi:hypothetical protein